MKKAEFLKIAGALNRRLNIVPLLYGSLGLEQRLHKDLQAEDIDMLIPEIFLRARWDDLAAVMEDCGYALYDLHEHAFQKDGLSAAFAPIESLLPFAGIEYTKIPVLEEANARYLLLDLESYRRVYAASSRDGYRKDKKHKNDSDKIRLIDAALEAGTGQ